MMNCKEINELIDSYIEKDLSENLVKMVESHLFKCPACSHNVTTLSQTKNWLKESLQPAQPDEIFFQDTLTMLKQEFADQLHTEVQVEIYQLPLRLES